MAQIVTITNPLTGQPAQVDQLEHTAQQIDDAIARALPGGAIDLEKAPAGYGLGGNGTEVSDWNNATANGFYRDGEGTEGKHSPFVGIWSCGYVTNYSSGALVQVAFGFQFTNGRYALCEKHRGYANGGWFEWEWVNPPMALGVEYRTTERYMGKPVYAKAINLGAGPSSNAQVSADHNIANVGHIVDFGAELTVNGASALSMPYKISNTNQGWVSANHTHIVLYAGGSDLTGYNQCTGWIKCTKTTD